jgi:serine/threonine protein kinase
MSGQYSYPYTIPISTHARDLIDRFLKNDPEERISLEDALLHPWFDQLKAPRKEPRKPKPKSSFFSIF